MEAADSAQKGIVLKIERRVKYYLVTEPPNPPRKDIFEPIPFTVSPRMLQVLAAQELALHLCRHIARTRFEIIQSQKWDDLLDASLDPPKIEGMPPLLEKFVKLHFSKTVCGSICKWFEYHTKYVYYDHPSGIRLDLLNCIDELELQPDGLVDYRRSAKNILKTDKLDEFGRFKLACVNCLSEDVGSLWPAVMTDRKLNRCHFEKSPLVCYWTSIMKGSIQPPSHTRSKLDFLEKIIQSIRKLEWSTVEYFWNFMTVTDRVTVTDKILVYENENELHADADILPHLFLKLDDETMEKLMEEFDDVNKWVFFPLVQKAWKCHDLALDLFNRFKYYIRDGEFHSIIITIVKDGFRVGKAPELDALLYEMWQCARADHKYNILQQEQKVKSVFKGLAPPGGDLNYYRDCATDMTFFVQFTRELIFERRHALWYEFWPNFVLHGTVRCLDNMLRLCLSDQRQITLFKEHFLIRVDNIKLFFCNLVKRNLIAKMETYLNFCTQDRQLLAQVKSQLLKEALQQKVFPLASSLDEEGFVALDKFIDGAFLDPRNATDYKKSILQSSRYHRYMFYSKVDRSKLGLSWE